MYIYIYKFFENISNPHPFFSKKKRLFLHHVSCPMQDIHKTPKGRHNFFGVTEGKMQKAIDARFQGGVKMQELDVGRLQLLPPKKDMVRNGDDVSKIFPVGIWDFFCSWVSTQRI